jgi:hypothetical protein
MITLFWSYFKNSNFRGNKGSTVINPSPASLKEPYVGSTKVYPEIYKVVDTSTIKRKPQIFALKITLNYKVLLT